MIDWTVAVSCFFGYIVAMMINDFMRFLGARSYRWWRARITLRSFEIQQRQWLRDWKKSDPKGAPR